MLRGGVDTQVWPSVPLQCFSSFTNSIHALLCGDGGFAPPFAYLAACFMQVSLPEAREQNSLLVGIW